MPRELADVLHYFLPELEAPAPVRAGLGVASPDTMTGEPSPAPAVPIAPAVPMAPAVPEDSAPSTASTLPIVASPVGEQDVVRAALLWNLAVEVARRGGRALLLRPDPDVPSTAWPTAGRGPLGVEVVSCPARNLGELYRQAVDLALLWASESPEGGLILVQIPPAWLRSPGDGATLLRRMLLFTTCDPADIRDTYGLAKLLIRSQPLADVGVTIHGANSREEAERTFETLARTARAHLGRSIESYGLLVDDLHVYRAVLAQRPIGLAHPQSLAARALHDVAGLLLEDARDFTAC